jgi:hypothetical protein
MCGNPLRQEPRAASMLKSGFGSSLLTNMARCPQMQAVHLIVTPSSPRKYIERYISEGWADSFLQSLQEQNVAFLLLSCCSSLVSDDFLSHSRFLAIDLNKSKLFSTIKMLSDLFHSDPEGPQAIYR